MQKVSFVEFRKHLSEFVGQARFANERIAVTHHGKVVGGFVSAEALHLLEELEMQKDIEVFDRGMESIKKQGTISLEEFRKGIGLE
ncbi:MAG: type II toxin-antitoxin system Phd/YefM family antitoxin [Parachlamydia sp.]|nr:type II toxin-antitoxin system Phd/YefM family antitoxin [Parachlamydia sp.]